MSPAEERAFVLHQFLALRRSGLPALTVLERLVEALPEGETRRACQGAAQRLLVPPSPEPADALVQVLSARGDDLGPASALALAADTELELSAARRALIRLFQLCSAIPPLALLLVARIRLSEVQHGAALPAPTELLFSLASTTQWLALPLAAVLIVLLERKKTGLTWGGRALWEARFLFLAAAAPEPERALSVALVDGPARGLANALARRSRAAEAFVFVGQRLEREGRRQLAVTRAVATVLAGFALLNIVGGMLIALYLPIFSIAGSIK